MTSTEEILASDLFCDVDERVGFEAVFRGSWMRNGKGGRGKEEGIL